MHELIQSSGPCKLGGCRLGQSTGSKEGPLTQESAIFNALYAVANGRHQPETQAEAGDHRFVYDDPRLSD